LGRDFWINPNSSSMPPKSDIAMGLVLTCYFMVGFMQRKEYGSPQVRPVDYPIVLIVLVHFAGGEFVLKRCILYT
jgi:hypothetical protein